MCLLCCLVVLLCLFFFFFFNDTATTEIYTLSLHDALPIATSPRTTIDHGDGSDVNSDSARSEEHTSELQSLRHLVCRLLLEKKKKQIYRIISTTKKKKNKINTKLSQLT